MINLIQPYMKSSERWISKDKESKESILELLQKVSYMKIKNQDLQWLMGISRLEDVSVL